MTTRTATARYDGLGREGKGHLSTGSGVIKDQAYDFGTRFGDTPGTNPEELIAAAHAACFTMALSFALAKEGFSDGTLETNAKVTLEKDGDGFAVTRSDLRLKPTGSGIDPAKSEKTAQAAKAAGPTSNLLKPETASENTLKG